MTILITFLKLLLLLKKRYYVAWNTPRQNATPEKYIFSIQPV